MASPPLPPRPLRVKVLVVQGKGWRILVPFCASRVQPPKEAAVEELYEEGVVCSQPNEKESGGE